MNAPLHIGARSGDPVMHATQGRASRCRVSEQLALWFARPDLLGARHLDDLSVVDRDHDLAEPEIRERIANENEWV